MICECRWLAIAVACLFTGLACFRTPMDEQQASGSGGGITRFGGMTIGTENFGGNGGVSSSSPAGPGGSGVGGTSGSTGGASSSAGTTGTTVPQGVSAATGSMTVARNDHTATLLPNGQVLIAGGLDERSHVLASAELYDPAAGKFTATGELTAARRNHTATLLPNGRVLIAGGGKRTAGLASAELYQ
jgi:hypothetical protein